MRGWLIATTAALLLGGCVQVLGNPFVIVEDDGGGGSAGQTASQGGAGGMSSASGGGGQGAGGAATTSVTAVAAQVLGGTGTTTLLDMAVAGDGSVVLVGSFNGKLQADTELDSGGSISGFVVKIAADGSVMWGDVLGDGQGTQSAFAVAISPNSGDVVVGGTFSSTYPLSTGSVATQGSNDIFVASYSSLGAPKWDRTFGGTGGDHLSAIAAHDNNRIMLAGEFSAMISFGGSQVLSAGGVDGFMATLSQSGSHVNSQSFGGPSSEIIHAGTVDAQGNSYVTGRFMGAMSAGALNATSNGGTDLFVVKFGNGSNPAILTGAGGPGAEEMTAIDVGSNGTAAMAANYASTFTHLGVTFTNGGATDLLFAIAPPDQMSFEGRGFPAAGEQRITDIELTSGKVVFAGRVTGALDLGGIVLPASSSASYFIAGFDTQQQLLFATSFGEQVSADTLLHTPKLGVDNAGNMYVGGTFNKNFTIDGLPLATLDGSDIFLIKFQ